MICKLIRFSHYLSVLRVASCELRVAGLLKSPFLIIIFSFFLNIAESQVVIEQTIDIQARNIYADNFDNLYVLSNNAFIKYSSEGEKLAAFYAEGGEEITYADVRNPFKIIVIFEQQNKLLILDNNLTPVSNDIFLDETDIFGDALISGATIGGYWIYDKVNNQLLKLNSVFDTEYKKSLFTKLNIISITDNASNIFTQTDSGRIYSYNYISGNSGYMPEINVTGDFSVKDDVLIYFNTYFHRLELINLSLNNQTIIMLPKEIEIIDATTGNTRIFFFDDTKVYVSSKKQD